MVPTAGLSDQVTALLLVPVTEALKVADAPAPSDTEAGPIVTATGVQGHHGARGFGGIRRARRSYRDGLLARDNRRRLINPVGDASHLWT